jgi:hypothetical protein
MWLGMGQAQGTAYAAAYETLNTGAHKSWNLEGAKQ